MRDALVILAAAVSLAATAAADGPAELNVTLERAQSTATARARSAWDAAAEKELVGTLDLAADQFHGLAGQGLALGVEAERLLAVMESTRERYTAVIEQLQAEVIRIDGDLEAVQDSKPWREREELAMRLLYRINWVRYEIATRYETDTGKRVRLLDRARAGFADMLGSGDRELEAESLFGHGLVAKAMRSYAEALADLDAALALEPPAGLRRPIEISRTESLVGAGRIDEALAASARMLASSDSAGESRHQALFLRAKVVLLILERGRLPAPKRHELRTEAARRLEELYETDAYWRSKVVQMVDAGIEEPLQWAAASPSPFLKWLIADSLRRRASCEEAAPLFNALLEEGRFESESLFGLAYCHYHAGRYHETMAALDSYMARADPAGPQFGEAAYLRFKAAEASSDPAYLEAAEAFVRAAPGHGLAYEAWFRLGQARRDRGLWKSCAEAFESVRGERGVRLKAMFMGAQCRVEKVLEDRTRRSGDPADAVAAVAACDRFVAESRRLAGQRPVGARSLMAPLEARSELMAAALTAPPGPGSHQQRLVRMAGFEERYPAQTELLPELLSLRIASYAATNNLDRSLDELDRLLASDSGGKGTSEALAKLAVAFIKDAGSRGPAEAIKLKKAALSIYRHLLAAAQATDSDGRRVAGLRKITAELTKELQH